MPTSQHLQWTEPAVYRRAVSRKRSAGRKPDLVPWLIAAGISVVTIGAQVSRGEPGIADSWPISVAVSALVPAGLLAFLGLMTSVTGDQIFLSPKGINRNGLRGSTWTIQHWPWQQIETYSLDEVDLDGRRYRVLTIHDTEGPREQFALADRVDAALVEAYLDRHQIPLLADD